MIHLEFMVPDTINLNENYYLNMAENMIYTMNGEQAAALPGKVLLADSSDIFYSDGLYWVMKNGYCYILDDSFEFVLEPIEMVQEETPYSFTRYGLFVFDQKNSVTDLYGADGKVKASFKGNNVKTVGDSYIYRAEDGFYNLNTLGKMVFFLV